MKAGFAEREYTPEEGVIPGQIKAHYGKGKLTPLMAHAAVIESNGVKAVLVSLDIIFFTVDFANALRERISKATKIPTAHIFVHTTHTHTGCATDVRCWGAPADPDALIPVADAAVQAVIAAYESMDEVKLGTARGYETRYAFCRDFFTTDGRIVTNPGLGKAEELAGPISDIDSSVNVMRFDDMEGKALCFVVNYALHLDTNAHPDKFDADYAGWLRKALQREYGRDVVVLFLNGCCGNINHYDFQNQSHLKTHVFPKTYSCMHIGEGLAETVKSMTPPPVPKEGEIFIQGRYCTFPTARRVVTPEHKEWAKRYLAEVERAKAAGEKFNEHDRQCAEIYLEEDPEKTPRLVDIGIHVLQIGDIVFVGLPGEIFSEIGLKIKANSPFAHTVVVELADGWHGYIAPDYVLRAGCYESGYSNISYTGYGTEDVLVNGATAMLRGMYEAYRFARSGDIKDNRLFKQ